jgi:hypothetical protein
MEVTVKELAAETGYKESNIIQLIKRGYLPQGRKEGNTWLLPYVESKLILMAHKPGQHWVKKRPRPGKRKEKPLEWDQLL